MEKDMKMGVKQDQVLILKSIKKTRNRLSNEPFTTDEVKKLLESVTKPRDHVLLLLGFNSGMRVSEAVSMEGININEAEGYVTIWDEKKNKYRQVKLPKATISALLRFEASKLKKSVKMFDFSTKTAENIIQFWTNKILGKKKSWHCVRHTYVTLQSIAGTPIPVVAENTGDSPSTILKYYTNIPPQVARKYVEENAVYKE